MILGRIGTLASSALQVKAWTLPAPIIINRCCRSNTQLHLSRFPETGTLTTPSNTTAMIMVIKIFVQAFLAVTFLFVSHEPFGQLWNEVCTWCTPTTVALFVWGGFIVNALVPFLQVTGQQLIGPTRSQTIYASQPLWASMMSFGLLGETVGLQGLVGGSAFLLALFLAATAEPPESKGAA